MEDRPVAHFDERLLAVLATLEKCRADLAASGNPDTAQLVSVAVLDIRMKLNQIGDDELKALCDEMLPDSLPAATSRDADAEPASERHPLLRLVK
jgi:hypothetical protein